MCLKVFVKDYEQDSDTARLQICTMQDCDLLYFGLTVETAQKS